MALQWGGWVNKYKRKTDKILTSMFWFKDIKAYYPVVPAVVDTTSSRDMTHFEASGRWRLQEEISCFVLFLDASVISCNANVAQLHTFSSTEWYQQNDSIRVISTEWLSQSDINRLTSTEWHQHSEINRGTLTVWHQQCITLFECFCIYLCMLVRFCVCVLVCFFDCN